MNHSMNLSERLREEEQVEEQENLFPHYIIFTILTYLITTCILLINSSVFFAFIVQRIRRPNLARLSPAGVLVLNLLFADGFVGAVTIIMTATETKNMAADKWICTARVATSYLALIGSHVALINVAADRYVAIMHTLHYRDWMTMKRSFTMIACGWMIPLTGATAAFVTNTWHPGLVTCEQIESFRLFLSYVWIPSHVLALLIVVTIQIRVYLYLRHHESVSETTNNVLKHYSKKSVQVLYCVSTNFVVCWGPFDVVLLAIIFWPNPVLKIIYDVSAIVAHFSFLVNPCVYSYKTENIRKPVSALWSDIKEMMFCRKKVKVNPPTGVHPGRKQEISNGVEVDTDTEGKHVHVAKSGFGSSVTQSTQSSSVTQTAQNSSLDGHGHI